MTRSAEAVASAAWTEGTLVVCVCPTGTLRAWLPAGFVSSSLAHSMSQVLMLSPQLNFFRNVVCSGGFSAPRISVLRHSQ